MAEANRRVLAPWRAWNPFLPEWWAQRRLLSRLGGYLGELVRARWEMVRAEALEVEGAPAAVTGSSPAGPSGLHGGKAPGGRRTSVESSERRPDPAHPDGTRAKRHDGDLLTQLIREVLTRRREDEAPTTIGGVSIADAEREKLDKQTERHLVYEMQTLLLAGHETSAAMLTFALHELSRHPDVMNRVRAEADAALGPLGGPDGRTPTAQATREAADSLEFTHAVLRETLRKWSVVPVVTRWVAKDDGLPVAPDANAVARAAADRRREDELAGVDCDSADRRRREDASDAEASKSYSTLPLKRGSYIMVSIRGVHRAHWSDPDAFRPERFLPGGEYDRFPDRQRPFMFVPFSAGPRNCLGQWVSLLEARIVLARLVQAFDVVRPGGTEADGAGGAAGSTATGASARTIADAVRPPPVTPSNVVIPVATKSGLHLRIRRRGRGEGG